MDKIVIKSSLKSPAINFDKEKALIEIRGRSTLENSKAFYEPLLSWLNNYVENPEDLTIVNIELEYYNTSSSLWIFQIFRRLNKLNEKNKELVINWYYADEDLLDAGTDFEQLTSLSFNKIESSSF
jgi:hypothetical protein